MKKSNINIFLLLIITYFLATTQVSSQGIYNKIDSLVYVLEKTNNDSIKLNIYSKLSYIYSKTNPDTSLLYAKKGIRLANKRNKNIELAKAYTDIGFAYKNNSEDSKSLEYLYKAIDNFNIAFAINKNDTLIQSELSRIYNSIGEILIYSHNYKKANEYIDKSIKLNNKYYFLYSNTNTYLNKGMLYYYQKNIDKAIIWWKKALKNSQKYKQTNLEGRVLSNLGSIFYSKNDFNKAQQYYRKAYNIQKAINNNKSLMKAANNMGFIYNALEKPDSVIKYSTEALNISNSLKQYYSKIISLNNIAMGYIALNNTDSAKKYHLEAIDAIETYYTKQNSDKINELETKYDLESKNKEIEILKDKEKINQLKTERKQTQLLTIIISSLLIIGTILTFFISYRRQQNLKKHKLEKNRLELEQRLLRSQMNPHFIFNALNSIQSFITTNNTNDAEIFLSKFALLIRNILENSSKPFIKFDKEIETIELYLQLEQLRFNNKFSYKINNNLDDNFLSIPPMLIQPFVENAIIHGIRNKDSNGNIEITFNEINDNSINCIITDDGVGREKSKGIQKDRNSHNSFAHKLTMDRLNFYNNKNENSFNFQIIDLFDDDKIASGTKIILTIPYK